MLQPRFYKDIIHYSCGWYPIIFLTTLVFILNLSTPTLLQAFEWNYDHQLTELRENQFYGDYFLVNDSEDNIHLLCNIYEDDESYECVYQKFSRKGEALSELIYIMDMAEYPDTFRYGQQCFDLWLSPDDELVILIGALPPDTDFRFHYFIVDANGNSVVALTELPGLFEPGHHNRGKHEIVKDSDDDIVVSYCWQGRYILLADTLRPEEIFYQRYDPDGILLGSTYWPAGIDEEDHRDNRMMIDSEDNIHLCWKLVDHDTNPYYYSKINPNDSLIIDQFLIEPEFEEGTAKLLDCELDSRGRPLLLCEEDISEGEEFMTVRKYDDDMNELFKTRTSVRHSSDIYIDGNDEIHNAALFNFPYWIERLSVGYSHLDSDGEFIDSALSVHEYYETPPRDIVNPKVFACEDGFVGVTWFDRRGEIRLSYNTFSSVNEYIPNKIDVFELYQAYPNPFNSIVRIPITAPLGDYTYSLFYLSGRLISASNLSVSQPGLHTLTLSGLTSSGKPLPNGQYLFMLSGEGYNAVQQIVLLK